MGGWVGGWLALGTTREGREGGSVEEEKEGDVMRSVWALGMVCAEWVVEEMEEEEGGGLGAVFPPNPPTHRLNE